MKTLARIGAALSLASALVAAPASAQPLPSGIDVIAKHVEAVGGKDALAKITSMQQKGTMEIPAMGLSATMELYAASPNKMSMKQSIPAIGEMVSGYDGTNAWQVNPMQGPRVLSGKELEQFKEQADFDGNMQYAADRYTTIENTGLVDFNNEKAYKVRFIRKGSGRETFGYFSQATGLAIGSEMTQETEMGKMSVTATTSDYKQFGAIKVATRQEMSMGATKIINVIQDVQFNNIPANVFDAPAAVKALIKP